MKKITACILTVLLLALLTACGQDQSGPHQPDNSSTPDTSDNSTSPSENPTSEGINEDNSSANSEATAEKPSLGVSKDGVYTNSFLGLTCKLNENWILYTEDQILTLNNFSKDTLDAQLERAVFFYDMYAMKNDGSSLTLVYEKSSTDNAAMSTADYIDSSLPGLESSLTQLGAQNVILQKTNISFLGKQENAIRVVCDMNGITIYESVIILKTKDYFINITVGTPGSDTTAEILSLFSTLS